jgi:hypothetical protein
MVILLLLILLTAVLVIKGELSAEQNLPWSFFERGADLMVRLGLMLVLQYSLLSLIFV